MKLCRKTDVATGTCYSHTIPRSITGTISNGSGTFEIDGLPGARIGDLVDFDCGHQGVISTGSPTCVIDGKGAARVGDSVVGNGASLTATLITGSPTMDSP